MSATAKATEVVELKAPPIVPAPPMTRLEGIKALLSRAAADPSYPLDRVDRLLDMLREAETEEAERAFNVSMANAQREMRVVGTDRANSQTHSRYASYAHLDRAIRDLYTKHGFAISYDTEVSPKGEHYMRGLAYVTHDEGGKRVYKMDLPIVTKGPKGNDVMTPIHATGSSFTYLKRYLLGGIFNIAIGEADDDGNGGTDLSPINQEQTKAIYDALAAINADMEKFLIKMQVDAIEDIPASSFDGVMKWIEHAKNMRAKNMRAAKQKEIQATSN